MQGVYCHSQECHLRPHDGSTWARPRCRELPCSPKSCPNGPFSGSEVSFAVSAEACHWLGVLNAVHAVLETNLMVAPFASIELRIQGFDEHVQV